ncbi:MAG: hypothetical protein HY820_27950 [Acidobacteria bacterium]|nr:hypothetical protein [Acidobacteriota bacterium]
MNSAWQQVPLDDYEAHMGHEGTAQLTALSDLFALALEWRRPQSVAVLGVAGGNGLDRVDGSVTTRIVGIDINSAYLDAVRERFPAMPGLELHCLDLSRECELPPPVALTHCALVFEHSGLTPGLDHAIALTAPDGAISVVLQLPSETTAAVTPTPFESIRNLAPHFRLVNPAELEHRMSSEWTLEQRVVVPVPGGKALWLGMFLRKTVSISPPRAPALY